MTFRMSEEESKVLDSLVKMSGLSKQDYLVDRALQQTVVVKGTPKVYHNLKEEAEKILIQLEELKNTKADPGDLLETIRYLTAVLDGFKNLKE